MRGGRSTRRFGCRVVLQGSISRREFAKAMAALGLQAEKEDMNRLFEQFDLDRNETIE